MLELIPILAGAVVGGGATLLLTGRLRVLPWALAALAGVCASVLAGEQVISLLYPAIDALLGMAGLLAARVALSALVRSALARRVTPRPPRA